MIQKQLLISIVLLSILSIIAYAEQSNLGTFKKDSCVDLIQTCSNCTYVNFTKVLYPNSTQALGNVATTKIGTVYNYTFCGTNAIGTYTVNGIGDIDAVDTVFLYTFEVNDRGIKIKDNTVNIAIIISLLFIIGLGSFLTFYLDSALKLPFFLGTVLTTVFLLNVIANIASDSGVTIVVVNLLWFGYKTSLYIFWALFLYVMIKLTVELKIKNNAPPKINSPMRLARERREQRQRAWQ